ncbi:hypothetical protein P1X15_27820 [Runella sp. MFBS21]|uniref:hypothetical protein n=1 Tax=Runella sp. MFBS21 TaxID=3034018 RepID=UPI0023F79932|nr:hypothetical protein [Runella sp. MFBS21]MDF7821459.1 hypothetical protein [Runella sp. MFBS21]
MPIEDNKHVSAALGVLDIATAIPSSGPAGSLLAKVAGGKSPANEIIKSTINKNSNDTIGNFILYEIKAEDGLLLKVGKADANRTTALGDPVRMKHSERKAQKIHPGATAEKVQDLGSVTTKQAKEAEAARVRD